MRSIIALLVAFALALGACGAGQSPLAIAEQQLEASRDGDWAAWRALLSDEAVHVGSQGDTRRRFAPLDWVEEDFDGDGIKCIVDWNGFVFALGTVTGYELSWECVEVAEDQVECTINESDTFLELTGLVADPYVVRYTTADGLITKTEVLPGVNGVDTGEPMFEEMVAYERWVFDTYPDRWADLFKLFDGECCWWNVKLVEENIEVHGELFEEYLDHIGFEA